MASKDDGSNNLKKCTKCGIEKEFSEFYKNKNTKDGFRPWCKECVKEYTADNQEKVKKYRKEYRNKNKVKITAINKEYYENNKEKILKQCKEHRANPEIKEKLSKYKKEYRDNNKVKIKKCQQKHYEKNKEKVLKKVKEYVLNNQEKVKKYRKEYRNNPENREKILKRDKEYYEDNKEEIKKYVKEYSIRPEVKKRRNKNQRNRRKTDINFKLLLNLRGRIYDALKRNSKCRKTMELLGCSIEELKLHLEAQFTEGMSWDNSGRGWHGKKEWHIDHKRPCASFDLSNPEQQQACFHYTNLQPLWAKDNLRKHNKYEEACDV